MSLSRPIESNDNTVTNDLWAFDNIEMSPNNQSAVIHFRKVYQSNYGGVAAIRQYCFWTVNKCDTKHRFIRWYDKMRAIQPSTQNGAKLPTANFCAQKLDTDLDSWFHCRLPVL